MPVIMIDRKEAPALSMHRPETVRVGCFIPT